MNEGNEVKRKSLSAGTAQHDFFSVDFLRPRHVPPPHEQPQRYPSFLVRDVELRLGMGGRVHLLRDF